MFANRDVSSHISVLLCALQLRHVLKVIPVKEGHALELYWQTPPNWKNWKSGPLNFISHLLGHEGVNLLGHEGV